MQYRKTLKKRNIKGFKGLISILIACLALDWLMLNFQWYTSLPQYHWTDNMDNLAACITGLLVSLYAHLLASSYLSKLDAK